MFKGKKSVYFLLPLNLIVWAYIGYKIYSGIQEDEFSFSQASSSPVKLKRGDTLVYSLNLNYDDPFLKSQLKQFVKSGNNHNEATSTNMMEKSAQSKPKPEPPQQIDIKYLGLVQNKTKGNTTALVNINGKSHLVKPGESIDDIKFFKVTPELIRVNIGKQKMTIKKI